MKRQFFDTIDQQAIKLSEDNLKLKADLAQAKAEISTAIDVLYEVFTELIIRHPINSHHVERGDCSTCKTLMIANDMLIRLRPTLTSSEKSDTNTP